MVNAAPQEVSSVHNYYVRCSCDAMYSDPIEKCPACSKANPDLQPENAAQRAVALRLAKETK